MFRLGVGEQLRSRSAAWRPGRLVSRSTKAASSHSVLRGVPRQGADPSNNSRCVSSNSPQAVTVNRTAVTGRRHPDRLQPQAEHVEQMFDRGARAE